ncbi:glucose-1-phosphate adenylyltransferase subunit GlgD [Periweissella cryptocerci]|uniref:Glucose-1-phosphate adenylyltransferase subunit GlgD n=1 Tax=Periweissella cryptocerci TaxID=2506420 RepID=A0A4P6YUI9_9LACO|nr:glucose-1-phosphate adenylyltransferase subunit GlgD [Periweissella cryptocerci]QBO36357.1 glucose-1-phosphate adenylyltransferase subunit GlgD [Periweissella cryptocerci]
MKKGSMSAIINLWENAEELAPITRTRPIGMLPFGGRYRLLDFSLSNVANADIQNVMIAMPTSGRSVQDHLRSGQDWNLDTIQAALYTSPYNDLSLVSEKKRESLKNHYYDNEVLFLEKANTEFTILTGARDVTNIDLHDVLEHHQQSDADISVAYKKYPIDQVTPNMPIVIQDGNGMATEVKRAQDCELTDPVAVSVNVAIFNTQTLIALFKRANELGYMDNMDAVINDAVENQTVSGYEYTGFHRRIETIKSYVDSNMAMLDLANYQTLFAPERPIYTKTKQGAPTRLGETAHVVESAFASGSEILGTVNRSLLSRSIQVAAGAEIDDSIVMQGVQVGRNTVVKHAIIDKNVQLGEGLSIIGTPDAPIIIGKNQKIMQQSEVLND